MFYEISCLFSAYECFGHGFGFNRVRIHSSMNFLPNLKNVRVLLRPSDKTFQ